MSFVHSKDYVTNLDDKCIQPNAVDLRIESLEEFEDYSTNITSFVGFGSSLGYAQINVTEDGKKEFAPRKLALTRSDTDQWIVSPHKSYDLTTKHNVKIPEGMVGWCHIRSTLSRNGIILSGGLYDAGYDGNIGFTIHNLTNNTIYLDQGVRVAQFIMGASETTHLYDGHYNQNGGFSK